MNKKRFAMKMIEIVDNTRFVGESDDEALDAIEALLDTLEPKDRDNFSQWGQPDDRTDPKDCWQ